MTGPVELVVLKTPEFGDPATASARPYRADRLADHGFELTWSDRRAQLTGRRSRVVQRIEAATTPFLQTWHLRRALGRAPVTLAFFESEGHGLALARALGFRRRTLYVVMSCWLGEIVPRFGPVRRALYRWLYRQVDLVTVFSANQIPIVCDALGVVEDRIHVLPFGIDTDEVSAHRVTPGDHLLAVGRDSARDWPTLFAGVAGTGRRVLVLARPSRLPDSPPPPEIEVIGYVDRDRYLDLLAGCAGVLIITNEVAYPSGQTVLLEALALGKRCVVSDTAAMRSFGDDLPWHRVPVGDASALRAAVLAIDGLPVPLVPRARLDAAAMWARLAELIHERLDAKPHQRPLHVASVIKGLGPGGAERLLVESATALRERGLTSSVVYVLQQKDHLAGDLSATGVSVRGLGVRRLADLRWLPRLVRALRTEHPDIVHVHSPVLAPVVRLAARSRLLGWRRPRVITTEHNAWGTYHPLTRVANALTAALDDVTLAVSDEVRDSIRPARLRARVRTVRHGIDTRAVRALGARRDAIRAELGIASDEIVVVTVANYRAQKNYPSLLRAARRVIDEVPRARFVMVGQGPLRHEVEALHRELGLGDRVLLLGYRPDAAAIIGAGDVFTLASDYEGLPVALMEALAHGIPVVATRVGGVAETIDASSGVLVEPGQPDALAAALIAVIADDARRHRLAHGAATAGATFDVDRAALTLESVYRRAAAPPTRR